MRCAVFLPLFMLSAASTGLRGGAPARAQQGLAPADALLERHDNAAAASAYEALGPQKAKKREGWRQNNWGLALLRLDKPAAAEGHFEKAVEADRANFIARANLGAAWEREGDLTKALDVYTRALELIRAENKALAAGRKAPEADEEAGENRAATAPAGAAAVLTESASPLDNGQVKDALAKAAALLDAGRYAEAGAAYAAIGRTAPAQREGWRLNNWGLCYLRLADPAAARERLERSVQAYPGNAVAWSNLAMAYEQLGLTDKAEQALDRGGAGAGAEGADPQRLELVRLKLAFSAQRRRWEALRR